MRLNSRHKILEKRELDKLNTLQQIRLLKKGDIFGEIAMFTNLKRTTTIISQDYMMVQSLDRQALEIIFNNAPNVYNEIRQNLTKYEDREIVQRFKFIRNVPFLRELGDETVREVLFKTHQNYGYQAGDCILRQGQHSPIIYIVA